MTTQRPQCEYTPRWVCMTVIATMLAFAGGAYAFTWLSHDTLRTGHAQTRQDVAVLQERQMTTAKAIAANRTSLREIVETLHRLELAVMEIRGGIRAKDPERKE